MGRLYLMRNNRVILRDESLALVVETDNGICGNISYKVEHVAVDAHVAFGSRIRQSEYPRLKVGRNHIVAIHIVGQSYHHLASLGGVCLSVDVALHTTLDTVNHHNHVKLY